MNEEVVQLLQLQLGGCSNTTDYTHSVDADNCITTQQFQKICRTCLVQGEHRSIFEVTYDQKAVCEILNLHASIQVYQGDRLPQNMCSGCLGEVFRMYYFIQKCQRSENMLQYVLEFDSKDEKLVVEEAKAEGNERILQLTNTDENNQLDSSISDNRDDDDSNDSLDEDADFSVKKEPTRKIPVRKIRKRRRNIHIRRSNSLKVQGPPFRCRDCEHISNSYVELRIHRKEAKHPEARNHSCTVCSKTFTSSKLRQHMRAHTKEKPYQCKVCFQGFSMSGNLKRHMMTHTGERPHVCEVCGKGFIQATTLQNHKKTHAKYERIGGDANSPHFLCNYCGRGFKRLARYNAHLKKHFDENIDVKKPAQDDEPREHVCMICKRAYKTKHLLKAHQLTHGEKTFLCSECGKGFVTKAALHSHLKVHTGEKPHTCNVCKKSFAHVGSFEAHMLIHTGKKPYNCNICAKAFTQLSHLKYHLRTHSGERPYICSFCSKSFALKGNLTVHVRTHTGETPYLCPICGKGFYDSSSMKKHKRGHGDIGVPPTSQTMGISVVGTTGSVDVINSISCVGLNPMIT